MDVLHEGYPFLLGLLLSPLFALARAARPRLLWAALALAPAVVVGACASALNGELAVGLPEGLFAVAADSMLVYGGGLVAWWLLWRRLLARRETGATARRGR